MSYIYALCNIMPSCNSDRPTWLKVEAFLVTQLCIAIAPYKNKAKAIENVPLFLEQLSGL